MSNEDPFEGLDPDEFDVAKIGLEEAAKQIVTFYRAFMKAGLTVPEAAALTAAMFAQNIIQYREEDDG